MSDKKLSWYYVSYQKETMQNQQLECVLKYRCSATVLKQLKTPVKELFHSWVKMQSWTKSELNMNSLKCIFQKLSRHFQKGYTSEEVSLKYGNILEKNYHVTL